MSIRPAHPVHDLPVPPRRPTRPAPLAATRARRLLPPGEPVRTDLPTLHLLPRHGLADGHLAGAEAVLLRPLRSATGTQSLFDHAETLMREVGTLGAPWDGAIIAVPAPSPLVPARIIGQVAAAIAASGLAATRLDLLLPEAALADLDADGMLALAALRDRGLGLCIDGFGAGAASLTLLRSLPLTGLKLARALVRALPADGESAAILRAIAAAARALSLAVIADGVETEAQRVILAEAGCDLAQGPLFGPPLPVTAPPRNGLPD